MTGRMQTPVGRVGTRALRKEDDRILTGRGRYVDDVAPRGLVHVHLLRSPHAHANVLEIDTTEARHAPGVIAVLTGADFVEDVRELDFSIPLPGLVTPAYRALTTDRVRYQGEPVAAVVAESRALAEDAAALIGVSYEPLPAVVTIEAATGAHDGPTVAARGAVSVAEPAVQLHDDVPFNTTYTNEMSNGDVDAAFARADRVVRDTIDLHRWAPTPMETRGGVAEYDPATSLLTYTAACQSPHLMRFVLSTVLGHPQHLLRVIGPDVGGSFGLKWSPYREDILTCAIARRLGRPVKWIEDRRENLTAGGHGRDHRVDVEYAVTNDGEILGMRADIVINTGAYPVMPSAAVTCGLIRTSLPGPYRVSAFAARSRVVVTNTMSHTSLRGPWAIETLARERAIDLVARELGMSPVEVRERNLLTPEDQPFEIASGHVLADSTARETLTRALERVDYPALQGQLAEARTTGRIVGFGIATAQEPSPGTPTFFEAVGFPFDGETARVRMEPDGHVTVFTAQMPHGQSHETTISQLVAETLGLPLLDVRIVAGDTQVSPFNMVGTGGSRAATFANGAALLAARALRAKLVAIAGKMLEAQPEDVDLVDGGAQLTANPEARVGFADIAMGAYMAPSAMPEGVDLDLEGVASYDGEGGGFSQATHCCWVEIDGETGQVTIPRYLIVEDCGPMINPAVVEGQIRGATAMGLSGMLLERIPYDDDGNCLVESFFDYFVASSAEIPDIEIEHLESASGLVMGSRGIGEGGTITAPAALVNALDDAIIAAAGRRMAKTPFTPTHVLEALGVLEN
jgi:carbon-monoxide dehydrogenase large subunit